MSDEDTHISVPNSVGPEGEGGARLDEPMTPTQASHLKSLAAEAGVPVNLQLNKREAARKIEELEKKSGRGSRGT